LQADHTPDSRLAMDMYVHRLKKAIGSLVLELDRTDALIFTDDIGEQNWPVRAAVCREMEWCGIQLDLNLNRAAQKGQINRISTPNSPVTVLAMPTDEEIVIAREGLGLLTEEELS